MTVIDLSARGVEFESRHVMCALVVPLIHVTVVWPPVPRVQVTENAGLAAPPGATRIAAARVAQREIPISFFIAFDLYWPWVL